MSDVMNANIPDDLDRLLAPLVVSADPLFRARLRVKTTRSLYRKCQRHRIAFVSALLACYAAGLATVWWLRPESGVVPPPAEHADAKQGQQLQPPTRDQTPQQLELLAEQSEGAESARFYLAAGRIFARDVGAWDAALRCYRNALDADPGLINSLDDQNDDWLWKTLKTARKKERNDAFALD
jgi:hypothetical protein